MPVGVTERWIIIPNWDSTDEHKGFQHYKDRRPVWIKNYIELLAKPEYIELTLPQRGLLHGLWLMYAESHRSVPLSTRYVSRRLSGRVTRDMLDSLNHAGFIEYSASKPLAGRYQAASPEKSREEKKNTKAVTSTEDPEPIVGQTNGLRSAKTLQAEVTASLRTP